MNTAITIHLQARLAWREAASDPHASILLLRVLELLEAKVQRFDDDSNDDALRWQALEARVDLCLQLLAQLLARDLTLPASCDITLSGTGASWHASQPMAVGSRGSLAIFLSSQIPQPLSLPAHIVACEQDASGWQISAHFCEVEPELQDWLDKTIFRHHRRHISQMRRHAQEGNEP